MASCDLKDFLGDAAYSTRAWTFQEYQLANRLLVFASNGHVYFRCSQAVCSEEVIAGGELEPDAAMLEGARMIEVRPERLRLWSAYREAVQAYTTRILSHQEDIIDDFSGILHTLYIGRCMEGIPRPIFDIAILWQPRERVYRRREFPSWAWAGWKGRVCWLENTHLESFFKNSSSETAAMNGWSKVSAWIVWHSSSRKNCQTQAFRSEGPPWFHGTAPSEKMQESRFPHRLGSISPTPTLMPDRLDRIKTHAQEFRYLQFWTISMRFRIDLERTAVKRRSSLEPENTGNGLRRFIIFDTLGQSCGWVLLDEAWIEQVVSRKTHAQEFILLSEVSAGSESSAKSSVNNRREYNAMMITWKDGIAERAGVGCIKTDADSIRNMTWREILLG
ncbi:hypothetical protein EK21DRAFT_88653 [Setomelanomma holmii]|uniref:Heterokaryon incompatibility domain-containing protein n=1 Tax=Setomelanomma holmii TaxID=210430 RepID=A0A9P4HCW0_9PLEO|nr:hypothetical protein EK21DRAFT_88653 [Setomelanomma holmii]